MCKFKIENFGRTILTVFFILIVSAISISAATFTVSNTNDSGAGSLRQALIDATAASGADTIVFDSSFNTAKTITLASSLPNYSSPDPLTINGSGANLLTVRGNDTFRIFTLFFQVATNANSEVAISGMTISNGFDNFFGGGAIFTQFGKVTINNVVLTANSGINGGAVQLFNGATLNANNSTISNNTVTGEGGALTGIQSSSINLTNTTVSGNTAAGAGGGISATDGATATINGSTISNNTSTGATGGGISSTTTLNVSNSTITGNSALQSGGGISNSGTATITNSNIWNNNSSGGGFAGGGGIASSGASLTITGSTISGNTSSRLGAGILVSSNGATTTNITGSTISNNILNTTQGFDGGGGLFLGGTDTATITNSTISGNTVTTTSNIGNGGGIYADGTLTLTSSTVAGNTAAFDGGGLYRPTTSGNPVNLRNSIFANNTAGGTAPDIFGLVNSNGFNLIKTTTGATITGTTATNITGVDPMLGVLAHNGGSTMTHALLTGSPAIDKGESSGSATDQRGQTRPVDKPSIPNAAGGDGADIGAFEDQPIVMFSSNSYTVNEPDGTATITVLRSGGTNGVDTVDYTTVSAASLGAPTAVGGSNCTEGIDFINTSGTLTFNNGESSKTFTVTICNDTLVENDEFVGLELSNPSGKTLGFPSSAFLRIISEDVFIPQRPMFDFDGDGKSDLAVFRPMADSSVFDFAIRKSSDNSLLGYSWGLPGDKLAPGDFDGDGKTDAAVYRQSENRFYILNSSDSSVRVDNFGIAGDILTVGDWDGDGKDDVAVYRAGAQSTLFLSRVAQ